MHASIYKIKAQKGDKINEGDVLVILEAMKMEIKIAAPSDQAGSVVASVVVAPGDIVKPGDVGGHCAVTASRGETRTGWAHLVSSASYHDSGCFLVIGPDSMIAWLQIFVVDIVVSRQMLPAIF